MKIIFRQLFWFRANQSLQCCNTYQFYSLLSNPKCTALQASPLTITPPMWLKCNIHATYTYIVGNNNIYLHLLWNGSDRFSEGLYLHLLWSGSDRFSEGLYLHLLWNGSDRFSEGLYLHLFLKLVQINIKFSDNICIGYIFEGEKWFISSFTFSGSSLWTTRIKIIIRRLVYPRAGTYKCNYHWGRRGSCLGLIFWRKIYREKEREIERRRTEYQLQLF